MINNANSLGLVLGVIFSLISWFLLIWILVVFGKWLHGDSSAKKTHQKNTPSNTEKKPLHDAASKQNAKVA